MTRTIIRLASLIILTILLAACGATGEANQTEQVDGTLNVVATTGQITDAVQNVAGDAVELTGMFGPGVDPHLYVPTEGDVTLLSEADIIFYNGLHLEAQMERVLDQMNERGIIVVAVGDALPEEQLLSWDTNYPNDPHVWNNPELWSIGVEVIRDTLVNADPTNETAYRQNAEAYLAEIAETHDYILSQVAEIPPENRVMITAHDAFGYYAEAYGFEVAGLQGISTESEASTADVQEIVDLIVARKIPAIFVESTVSPRNIEAVQAAVRAEGYEVAVGGQLYSDALGYLGTPEGTYIGMLRHNTDTLVSALSAPLEEAPAESSSEEAMN